MSQSSRASSKNAKKESQPPAAPVRVPRAGEAEINLVRVLYANDPGLLALRNRRITNLGLDGVAVMYDDDTKVEGMAVVKIDGANRKALVARCAEGYFVGGEQVEMKGWIHSILQVYETEFNPWPKPGQTLPF